jgi:hypothetical protein
MKRSAWMVVAMAFAMGACSGGKSGQEASFTEIPQGEWNELVGQLTAANDLDDAVATTREILARGGIATRDGERELVAAHPPAASFSVSPRQVEHMAMEARARGVRARLEVAEFAHMLASFGWEFPNARSRGDAAQPNPDIEDGYTQERRSELQRDRMQARESARKAEEDAYKAWQASVTDGPNARHDAARARIDAANKALRAASGADAKAAARVEVEAARVELAAAREAARAARETLRERQEARGPERDAVRESQRIEDLYARRIGPEYGAGEDFQLALERWVQEAAKDPEAEASFVPLFIAGMARLQDPPVDLADPQRRALGRPGSDLPVKGAGPRSGQTRLSLLEMQLVIAAFDRNAGTAADKALTAAFHDAVDGKAEAVSAALAQAHRVVTIASLQPAVPLDLDVEPVKVHRPVGEELRVRFAADADDSVRGSASLHWRLLAGAPAHAIWSLADNDGFRLEGGSGQSAAPDKGYVVDVRQEETHHGSQARGYVTARTAAEDEDAPSLEQWKEVAHRGFQRSAQELIAMMDAQPPPRGFQRSPEELLATTDDPPRGFQRSAEELAIEAGWLREMSMPRAYASIEVEYHCANPTTIHLYVTDPVADGRGDGGDACTYTFETREAFEQWREANAY